MHFFSPVALLAAGAWARMVSGFGLASLSFGRGALQVPHPTTRSCSTGSTLANLEHATPALQHEVNRLYALDTPSIDIKREGNPATYQTEGVPSGLNAVANQALEALSRAVDAGEKRLQMDILVPGLNPKLENSAPYSAGLLLAMLHAVLPALEPFKQVKILFSSAGDAAMAKKSFADFGYEVPKNVKFGGMTTKGINLDDDCVVFVRPKNSVGDPVVMVVRELVELVPNAVTILLNPDLGEKVALGIRERDRRQGFLDTFQQCYYFRNLYMMQRPDLVPLERGALLYQYGRSWAMHVCDAEAIPGPGSLNRFMTMAVYRRHPQDPKEGNPPKFWRVGEWPAMPSREEISAVHENSGGIRRKLEEEERRLIGEAVQTAAEAREVLLSAGTKRDQQPGRVLNALKLLEKDAKKASRAKSPDTATGAEGVSESSSAPPDPTTKFQRLTTGGGWKLVFTTGDKKTQDRIGASINYVPIKAVQVFQPDYTITNGIYLGSFPVIKFTGTFSWQEQKSRLEFDFNQLSLLGLNLPFSQGETKVKPGFTFIDVTGDYAAARGAGGGLALWMRVDSV